MPRETQGIVPGVVFPTATDLREDGHLDVYYGAADSAIGVAHLALPSQLSGVTASVGRAIDESR